MNIDSKHIKALARLLEITRDEELNCNEFLDQVAEYAELKLSGDIPEFIYDRMKHHLSICVECQEEYEALLKVLKSGESPPT